MLQAEGVTTAAVALAHEGAVLRKNGWRGSILLLEPTLPDDLPLLFRHRLTPQVSSLGEALRLDRMARRLGRRGFPVQVEVDSGMGRVGFRPEELRRDLPRISRLEGIRISAVYTHLATADWKDGVYARHQIGLFHYLRDELSASIPSVPWHLANSAALLGRISESRGNWMRPGLALYGVPPNALLARRVRLEPVMSFRAKVLQVKTIQRGESVGYNRIFTAARPTRVAVVAAGYADGILRSLSNKGQVLIRGRKVSMVGTVCMDMTMLDVTGITGVKAGDTATFFGKDGRISLPVEDQARAAGTIPYELLCALGPRVERVYVP
jgi:alanine racemase